MPVHPGGLHDDVSPPPLGGPDGPGLSRRQFLLGLTATTAVIGAAGVTGLRAAPAYAAEIPDPVAVPLRWTHDGVSTEGNFADGDFNLAGWSYPAEQLPTGRVAVGGLPFDFPPDYADGTPNFLPCTGQRLDLPPAAYAVLYVIGAAHHGNVDTHATVGYADGSAVEVPFQFTDWASALQFGEAIAVQCTHRHWEAGNTSPPVALFLQAIALDPGRHAVSVTLPDASNAKLIAVTARPAVTGVAVKVIGAGSTELFVGSEAAPRQVVRVSMVAIGTEPVTAAAPVTVSVTGAGVSTPEPARVTDLAVGRQTTVDIGVVIAPLPPEGTVVRAEAVAEARDATDSQPVDVPGVALPLRPGVVEHAGRVHRNLGGRRQFPAWPDAGAVAPRHGAPRPGLQVRPRGVGLPQAVLGLPSRGPRVHPATGARRPAGAHGRHARCLR